jgi:hypothetical protein
MSEGFLMSSHTAMLFFRICRRYGIDDRADRITLMREIVRRGHAKYIRDASVYTEGKKVNGDKKGSNNVLN